MVRVLLFVSVPVLLVWWRMLGRAGMELCAVVAQDGTFLSREKSGADRWERKWLYSLKPGAAGHEHAESCGQLQ